MSNDYYGAPSNKVPLTTIKSGERNNDAAAVEAGFDKLPSELNVKRSQYGQDVSASAALYEITIPNLNVAYYEGLEVTFQATFENTNPANISVNGGVNLKIVDTLGSEILAGSIKVDQAVTVIYILSPAPNFQLISTAATAQDVQDAKNAADAAEGFRDEAEGFRDEAEGFADDAEANGTTEQQSTAIALNELETNIGGETPGSEVKAFLRAKDQEKTYAVPADAQGKFIQSLDGSLLTTTDLSEYILSSERGTFPSTIELIAATHKEGDKVSTLGFYLAGDGGAASYTILPVGAYSNGYSAIPVAGGLVAELALSEQGAADFRQVGVKVFEAVSDTGFEDVDAGVILNALDDSPVLKLTSSTYGKVHLKTQYIDTKGLYIEVPRPSKIDTASEESFDIVCDAGTVFSNANEGPFVIKSGVRRGGIIGLVLSGGAGEAFIKMFSFGDALFEDDTANIISNYDTNNFIVRGGDDAIFCYQYFNCSFTNTLPRNYRSVGWWTEEGGTSVVWDRCLPLSSAVGSKGFVWNPNSERQGHIYSTMICCTPQLVDEESYIFRNCSMTLISCSEEFSSKSSDSTMLFIGTGLYNITNYTVLNANANKPQNIYGVRPTVAGRFGATLTIDGTTLGVTGFSGSEVGFMHYGVDPTTILSRARWDISNTNQKSDPTNAIDYETWKSGYYYNTFMLLKDQLESIETITRSGQPEVAIPLENTTQYTITGNITVPGGSAYLVLSIDTGVKGFISSSSRVDILATANADTTDRGKVLHLDTGTDSTYATANLYLKAFHKAGVTMFAQWSSERLRIQFEIGAVVVDQSGIWTITKAKSAAL